ncbi:hypothetical protein BLAT2472_100123 [Burkholderia latens]
MVSGSPGEPDVGQTDSLFFGERENLGFKLSNWRVGTTTFVFLVSRKHEEDK